MLWQVILNNFKIIISTVYKIIQEGNTASQKLLMNIFQMHVFNLFFVLWKKKYRLKENTVISSYIFKIKENSR